MQRQPQRHPDRPQACMPSLQDVDPYMPQTGMPYRLQDGNPGRPRIGMPYRHQDENPHRSQAGISFRLLTAFLLILLLLPACGADEPKNEPVPAALEIGYRRMFNHDRTEQSMTPFHEAVQKSGSITTARLDHAEDTGEGYTIYTFRVVESLYNPDEDKIIHLYEGYGSTPAANAYEKDRTYLLFLSRATDVYYPHPYFHNFNGIHLFADDAGKVLTADNADGRDNLLKDREIRKSLQTLDSAKAYIQSLLDAVPDRQRGIYRFSGREILSGDPAVIAERSDYIAIVRTDQVVFSNRYVQEVKCTIQTPYKGIFGLGSGPDPAENATPPATEIRPGHRGITVLFPSGLDVSAGKSWLVFLYEDAEYRISSRSSAVSTDSGETFDRFLASVETEVAVAPTPEPVTPTPEPPPKVYTLLDEYKDLLKKNKDVRGWIRQEGTVIDYPVLQSTDNDWYLAHNIDKKKVVTGSIVLDFRVDIKNLTRNTPVYGHNMKHGSMFHSLVNYKTEKYFREHPSISFDTLYEKLIWDIFAVYVVDAGYNYVITMDFKDDAEFSVFLDDIRKRSMYEFPFEVTTSDQIMTMVTCSYEFDGAKTVVQARLRK